MTFPQKAGGWLQIPGMGEGGMKSELWVDLQTSEHKARTNK